MGAGLALWVAGRVFGSQPVEQIGFGICALVAFAVGVVRLGRHDLHVRRRIVPERTRAHQPVTVTLDVSNKGRGRAPLVMLEDRVPPGISGRSRFVLPAIESGGEREASLQIRPEQRGRYEVGPLDLEIADPFSLARLRTTVLGTSEFVVHPRVERLLMPRDTGERRSTARAAIRQPTGPVGEDFYTIREYAEGDDLRKIHWGSTAKRGRPMIRHEETPWHTRITVILDDRRSAYGAIAEHASFDRAVSATASLLDLYQRAGYGYRLAGAYEPGLPSGKGQDHFNACLDLLAVIEPKGRLNESDPLLLARLAELEARPGAEATLVVVTGTLEDAAATAIARLKRVFRQMIVVAFPAHRYGTAPTQARWEGERHSREVAGLIVRSGGRVLLLGPSDRFSSAWASFSTRGQAGETRWDLKPEHA